MVVDTAGAEVYVGRCDDMDERAIVLLDVDVHRDGDGGRSKADYLAHAAQVGFWKKHDRLVLERRGITSIRPLGDL